MSLNQSSQWVKSPFSSAVAGGLVDVHSFHSIAPARERCFAEGDYSKRERALRVDYHWWANHMRNAHLLSQFVIMRIAFNGHGKRDIYVIVVEMEKDRERD